MKNVQVSTYTAEAISTLLDQKLNAAIRSQLRNLIAALNEKESFTVNCGGMSTQQSAMVHGVIRDVAKYSGHSFDEMKELVKKQFGITGSFRDLSKDQSINLCEQIRVWVNEG